MINNITMKPIIFFAVLIMISLLHGCDKGEYFLSSSEGKITEILNKEEQTIGKNSYDQNGLLKESWFEEDFYTPGEKAEYSYTFDSENRLTKKKGYEPGIMYMSSITGAMGKNVDYSYEYDSNGNLEKLRVNYDYDDKYNADYSCQTTFQYPEKSVIVSITNIIDPLANSLGSGIEYQFNSKGNIEKTINFYNVSATERRIISETLFTYDAKKAPYNFEPLPSSKNNVLKKTITVYNYDEAGNQSIAYTSAYSYEYTYNTDEYPVSQAETMPNQIVNFKYFKY
jgi:hypothetical protein